MSALSRSRAGRDPKLAHVIVVGGGPAGLMAADVVSAAGVPVALYERMPSVGRKLLMAGRGGLNLTHSEALEAFLGRYGSARPWLEPAVAAFPPDALRAFVAGLGQETFVGSSGRVFPRAMKASPLLRAWTARLAAQGVVFHRRHTLEKLDRQGIVTFRRPDGTVVERRADAIVLALGGASWPRLGSDGGWVGLLETLGVRVNALAPANAGVEIGWSAHFAERHAGAPLKRIAVTAGGVRARGEAVITAKGLEGGAIYQLNPMVRDELGRQGFATIVVDLRPDLEASSLAGRLRRPIGKQSRASFLRKEARLSPAAIGLLREALPKIFEQGPEALATAIKAVPLRVRALSRLARAISTAGGVALDEVGADMMLSSVPGIFVAGEMLDWEAPTGGYLLQACFSTGHAAGRGVLGYLRAPSHRAAGAESPSTPPANQPNK